MKKYQTKLDSGTRWYEVDFQCDSFHELFLHISLGILEAFLPPYLRAFLPLKHDECEEAFLVLFYGLRFCA